MSIFSDRLVEELELIGMKQNELAEKTNITPATISRYITGQRTPGSVNAKLIAQVIGVSTDYLLGTTNIKTQAVVENLKELNEEFPEGVDVLMRAKEELTPAQKKKMIELMHLFLDSLDEK